MAEAIYLWLKDSGGKDIKGGVVAKGREGSIEVLAYEHAVSTPFDTSTGEITSTRVHGVFEFMKQLDVSTPYLLRAVTDSNPSQQAVFEWTRGDNHGGKEVFFSAKLENVKVVKVTAKMYDIKDPAHKASVHMERIELSYEKITWTYKDGNHEHSDSWNEPKLKVD